MATTDTKSGFRLPWSQDRSHEDEAQPDLEVEAQEPVVEDDGSSVDEEPWPEVDVNARLGLPRDERPPEATASPSSTSEEPEAMVETAQAPAAAAPLRKQSKLIADLAAAMRSTAEVAREQSLAQVEADVKQVVEGIRSRSSEGATALRQRSDEDLAGIREWSKAEIARIREETEVKITKRKAALETELSDHAAAIDRRVEDVQGMVAEYENEMADFFERLLKETDPARLASMAETMPEPPSFDAWADVDDLASATAELAVDEPVDAPAATEPEPVVEAVAEPVAEAVVADAVVAEPEPVAEVAVEETAVAEATATPDPDVTATAEPQPEAASASGDGAPEAAPEPGRSNASWAESDEAWTGPATAVATEASTDDVPRWAAGETPDGFPTTGEGGEPVDRGAIMAALEAAAEAVVAAESAAESADQAEAAADVAETAAGLLVTRVDPEEGELDPEAAAALAARMDGFEAESSFADRLAALLPGHGSGDGGETVTTQLVVSGLVSVASIASFKRHLARIQGVQAVAVASGPDGEFVFNATHRSDVSFRDVVPSMPGFAARVTSTGDGIVHVTARDPEAEG